LAAVDGVSVEVAADAAVQASANSKPAVLNFFMVFPVVTAKRRNDYRLTTGWAQRDAFQAIVEKCCRSESNSAFNYLNWQEEPPSIPLPLLRKSRMSQLNILRYPDPRLHKVAQPVKVFDDRLKKLVADMAETMYEAPGVGLAATQVDVHEQLIVIDTSETHDDLKVFINPEITWASPEKQVYDEGCLSVPGVYDGVERPARVKVRALDLDGKPFEVEADGLLAVCIQHEMDHLQGKVFVEYLSPLKRTRIKTRMIKEERELKREQQKVVGAR
jgi:peptide deformylase